MRKIVIALFALLFSGIVLADFDIPLHGGKGSNGGRFQVVQISDFAKDQFLIDTQTGKLWRNVCAQKTEQGDCVATYWQEELIEGVNFQKNALPSLNATEPAKLKRKKASG